MSFPLRYILAQTIACPISVRQKEESVLSDVCQYEYADFIHFYV